MRGRAIRPDEYRDDQHATVKHVAQPGEETLRTSVDVQYLGEDTRPDNVIYVHAPVQSEQGRQQHRERQDAVMLNFGAAALQAA